jgi:hypothetical protein
MTITLVRHKGQLVAFGRLLAMKMLLDKSDTLRVPVVIRNRVTPVVPNGNAAIELNAPRGADRLPAI